MPNAPSPKITSTSQINLMVYFINNYINRRYFHKKILIGSPFFITLFCSSRLQEHTTDTRSSSRSWAKSVYKKLLEDCDFK